MRKKRFKIAVLTIQNILLFYTVSEYEITKGNFVEFVDEKTGDSKKFHASRCEITVVQR